MSSNNKKHVKLAHLAEYVLYLIVTKLLHIMPHKAALNFGAFLGNCAWHLGLRRNVARKNFAFCFNQTFSRKQSDDILRASYANFMRSMVEMLILPRLAPKIEQLVSMHGIDEIEQLASQHIGALLVTGHFGSWEIFGAALSARGIKFDAVATEQSNPLIDARVKQARLAAGVRTFSPREAVRETLRTLPLGGMTVLISDQDAGKHGVVVNFFGLPASTPKGAALFSLKTGYPLVVGYIVRRADGISHDGYCTKIFHPKGAKPTDDAIRELTQNFTLELENAIRAHPEQYFWAHRRFKSTLGY